MEVSALSPAAPCRALSEWVPADMAARAAARVGLVPGKAGSCPGLAAFTDATIDREALTALLTGDAFYIAETDAGCLAGTGAAHAPVVAVERGFYLSLITATAWKAQPAVAVCDALVRRGVLDGDHRSTVELCLHEAVANAIVHGNLGIASAAKNHPEGYRVFSQLLNDRLNDPERRHLRLEIFARWQAGRLDVVVCDQGQGFDLALLPQTADGNARSGRGFVFMRALADGVEVVDGGRCTHLWFSL